MNVRLAIPFILGLISLPVVHALHAGGKPEYVVRVHLVFYSDDNASPNPQVSTYQDPSKTFVPVLRFCREHGIKIAWSVNGPCVWDDEGRDLAYTMRLVREYGDVVQELWNHTYSHLLCGMPLYADYYEVKFDDDLWGARFPGKFNPHVVSVPYWANDSTLPRVCKLTGVRYVLTNPCYVASATRLATGGEVSYPLLPVEVDGVTLLPDLELVSSFSDTVSFLKSTLSASAYFYRSRRVHDVVLFVLFHPSYNSRWECHVAREMMGWALKRPSFEANGVRFVFEVTSPKRALRMVSDGIVPTLHAPPGSSRDVWYGPREWELLLEFISKGSERKDFVMAMETLWRYRGLDSYLLRHHGLPGALVGDLREIVGNAMRPTGGGPYGLDMNEEHVREMKEGCLKLAKDARRLGIEPSSVGVGLGVELRFLWMAATVGFDSLIWEA